LQGFESWQEKTLLGICWSSIAKYYFFTTIGSWLWHDEIHRTNVVELPICFPRNTKVRDRLVAIVEEMQKLELQPDRLELAAMGPERRLRELEHQLDDAIFDLYELTSAERELVRDMCSSGLDLFYRHQNSDAVREVVRPNSSFGVLTDVEQAKNGLAAYLRTFLEAWNNELGPDGEFSWRIVSPPSNAPLLAVCFTTRYKRDPLPKSSGNEAEAWHKLLAKLARNSLTRADASRIYIDTFSRHVTDREILFIKRNERRFWTSTAAREDAESALTHLMNLEEAASGGKR
jgi:hypothetical protein